MLESNWEGGATPPLPRNCKAQLSLRRGENEATGMTGKAAAMREASSQETGSARATTPAAVPRGTGKASDLTNYSKVLRRRARFLLAAPAFGFVPALHAVSVHGVVADPLNRPIAGAVVALVGDGKVLITARTAYDGSFSLNTSAAGRFYVLATGNDFSQLATESFYGEPLSSVERNITLEPASVRESVVVSATGTPLPESQVSASVTELRRPDFQNLQNVTEALRLVPGFSLAASGQRGGVTSLFIRGGNSDDNKILLDGVPVNDIGGTFDFSNVATTGISTAEAYRGPDSVVYGTDAGAGVVAFSTPRGSTPFTSLFYEGDGGNFGTYRNEGQLGGTRGKLDYYGAFGGFGTANSVAGDKYHNNTSVGNLGYALTPATTLRGTVRSSVSAVGAPGQYQFTRTPTDQKQSDQNLYASGSIDHTFSDNWLGEVKYGLTRKREQFQQFGPTGTLDLPTGNYLGRPVSVTGANGRTASGQAITSYAGADSFRSDLASNRDSLHAQTSYAITPHLLGVAGFWYTDERGLYFGQSLDRTNYDYTLAFQGDYVNRFFYTLGGGVEKNGLFGTVGAPHLGASYYLVRPRSGAWSGTRLNFNFSKGYKEPTLGQQTGSLYAFLIANGGAPVVNSYQVRPIGAALTRSYDGGVEQSLAGERVRLRISYFHNEFGNQIESVGPGAVPELLPQLSPAQQASLEAYLQANSAFGIDLNSLAFRAQGAESEVEWRPRAHVFLRGGYTYLDAKVQQSFSSDALAPSTNPAFPNISIGNFSPLVGARPFRRPPHTGFISATYSGTKWSGTASTAFASRADDTTALGGADANFGNSLLLPNRDLDYGYASFNTGINYQVSPRVGVYTQLENILSQQHTSPIGYLSTPATARGGVRVTLGHMEK